MEIEQTVSERQQQFSGLNDQLESAYATLQVQYHQRWEEMIEYKTQANFWHAQFDRQKAREASLIAENEALKAALRKRQQQLFGKSTEQSTAKSEAQDVGNTNKKRNRGQQPGSVGHGRRSQDHLPVVEETVSLEPEYAKCKCCGLSLTEMATTDDLGILEVINVSGYKRQIRHKKYRRTCECPVSEAGGRVVSVPITERLIAKSNFGISIWAMLLIKKYVHQQPLNRSLQELSNNGLPLAAGSMIDGFKKILPLLMPIYDLIAQRSSAANHWHADETGWQVFEEVEGKASQRWYLWIFVSDDAVLYKLDPTRSAKVPLAHLGEEPRSDAVLSADRYCAYKTLAGKGIVVLAFCWAHVRRDFIEHANGYPEEEAWAMEWVVIIGELYHINNQRLTHERESKKFKSYDTALQQTMDKLKERLNKEVISDGLGKAAKAILKSLDRHLDGLSIFVTRPEIPMDNNVAERALRGPVVGRKNYYGSHAVWSGELSAVMFTIIATLKLAKINPHTWLFAYFDACAKAQATVPRQEILEKFLPWNMSDERKALFAKPPVGEDSS